MSELKKTLKELRPKFDSVEKEIEYHRAAQKSLAAKERMAKVRAAKKSNISEFEDPATSKTQKKIPEMSAKREALLAQLAALGS